MKKITLLIHLLFFTGSLNILMAQNLKWKNVAPNSDQFLKLVRINDTLFFASAGNVNSSNGYALNPLYTGNNFSNLKPSGKSFSSHMGFSFHKSKNGNLYLSTGHAGVYKSNDSGKTWNYNIGSGFGCMAPAIESDSLGTIYIGIGGFLRGLHVSSNNGSSYTNKIGGLDFCNIKFTGNNGGFNRVLAINSNKTIYLSSDNGNNWNQITGEPFSSDAVMVANFENQIFVVRSNGDIYTSKNGCISWSKFSNIPVNVSDASPYLGNSIMFDKGKYIFGLYKQGLWSTLDDGATWKRLDTLGNASTTICDVQLIKDTIIILGSGGILIQSAKDLGFKNCLSDSIKNEITDLTSKSGGDLLFQAKHSDSTYNAIWQSKHVDLPWTNITANNKYSYNNKSLTIKNVTVSNHNQTFRVVFNKNNCYDTSKVATLTISDTCINTVFDTIRTTIYDTIAVQDTLLINAKLTGTTPLQTNLIKVYPNPAKDNLVIDFGNFSSMAGYEINIFDVAGKSVYSSTINKSTETIDLNTWTGKGVYLLKIFDKLNQQIENRKIVIQ